MYTSLLIFITLIVVATDTFAYLGGKLYGSHLLAPSISPNKTWEGLITGLLASVGIGLITANYLHYHLSYQLVVWIICISLATIAGDLFESYLKRRANLKDSGSLLPGHGGILDRIDGLLFATPVGYIFFRIFGL
jgi:phosphatidate cytidylyltransferase